MSTLLLDASAILSAFDPDDREHEAAARILADGSIATATLDLARYEVLNIVVCRWRSPEWVSTLLSAFDRIAEDGGIVESTAPHLMRAAELADEHGISVYDAAYVAAANQTGRRLVSCDIRDLVSKGLAISPEDLRKR